MAVLLETTVGDIVIDLYPEERPRCCLNFLKLCKMKYYNFNIFHSVQSNFMAQSGDPTGTGTGGESIFCKLQGDKARYFDMELHPRIKHKKKGCVSMVNNGSNQHGSQFFITLREDIDYLDGIHSVFGEVTEGFDVLDKISETFCDANHRPLQDIRINHTVILDDPFDDPEGLEFPDKSPEIDPYKIKSDRIAADEDIEKEKNKTTEQLEEETQEQETRAKAQILEMIGDLPDADVKPPENVLFVCKLNPVTTSEDLQIIFSRFGKIASCDVIKDQVTGDSLCYAFVEFEKEEDCEEAYFKMDNVLIDDRRIHVDFSQSVAKLQFKGKGPVMPHRSNAANKARGQSSRYDSDKRRSGMDRKGVSPSPERGPRQKDKRSREGSSSDSPSRNSDGSTSHERQRKATDGMSRDRDNFEGKRRVTESPSRSDKRGRVDDRSSDREMKRRKEGRGRNESPFPSPYRSSSRKKRDEESCRSGDQTHERNNERRKGGRKRSVSPPDRPPRSKSDAKKSNRESSNSPSPSRTPRQKDRSCHDRSQGRVRSRSSSDSASPSPKRDDRSGGRSHDKHRRRERRGSSESVLPPPKHSPTRKRDRNDRSHDKSHGGDEKFYGRNAKGDRGKRSKDSPSPERSRKRERRERSVEEKKGQESSDSASLSPDRSSRKRKERDRLDNKRKSSNRGRKHHTSSSGSSEQGSSDEGSASGKSRKSRKSHKTSKSKKKKR